MRNAGLNILTSDYYSSDRSGFFSELFLSDRSGYSEDEFNLSGFFHWENEVIDRFFCECKNVLVGAAGGGREIIALARKGIIADAFECNNTLAVPCKDLLERHGIIVIRINFYNFYYLI